MSNEIQIFKQGFRDATSWEQKRALLQRINQVIEHSAKTLTLQDEEIFLQLFYQDESVDNKVEKLQHLDPYKIGFLGVNRLINCVRKIAKPISNEVKSHLKGNFGIFEYFGNFGTGGDQKNHVKINTLNISTLASIIASSARDRNGKSLCPILKVGSLAVTSNIGASNFMSSLIKSQANPSLIAQQLAEFGFAFVSPGNLNIPYYSNLILARNKIFKLGICDIIKIVVPVACLTEPSAQITGVSDLRMLPFVIQGFQYLIQQGMVEKGIIVHSYDGIDELFNQSLVIEINANELKGYDLSPDKFNLTYATYKDIIEEKDLEKQIMTSKQIIAGSDDIPQALMDTVIWNAALMLTLTSDISNLPYFIQLTQKLINQKQAKNNFENFLSFHKSL